ncbi:hypothetical protein BKA58DRAFT_234946 [Alternaria rosae]|uniref:uncharacterized protein n=1 Tax=Alternaria rosae TaxID=1187941 RepID=UPI001E8DDB64|nr:uncharacterized protein BKA58DRAFT_234946 [Alternaria rosae]KAH6864899.1 hypothetical protein BKA58DRAFT_234946 [Alternaria rosae]
MFVTPVIVSSHVLDPSAIYGSKRGSVVRNELSQRHSIASSDASFGCLHRTSSTSSNASISTAASSTPSISDQNRRPKHRKTISNSSIARLFLQKNKPQDVRPKQAEALPTSASVTPTPSSPMTVATSNSPPAAEWQCSDLVVRSKRDVYHVDRSIMCYHSRWFARVCAVVMSPKSSKGIIDLSADDPAAVAAMMQYCYQLDYTDQLAGSDLVVPEDVTLRSHVDVYMLAERYGIAGLKALALKKFEDLAAKVVDGEEQQLLHAIRAIYAPERTANAEDLKRVAIKLCADHVQAFIHGTGRTMALVYESMDELPDFRADLFDEMASRWK